MSKTHQFEVVVFSNFLEMFNAISNFIYGNNKVIRSANLTQNASTFQAVTAYSPHAFISFQNVGRTTLSANLVQLFHLHIQLVFVKGFYSNDNVAAIFIVGQADFSKITCGTYEAIIHKFNTGGVKTSFNQIGNKVNCLLYVGKYSKNIQLVGAHGQKLQGCFGNDTQSTFTTHNKLVKAVASATFFQTITQLGNFAGRSNYFNAINLVAGSTITYSLVTTCVSSNVTANQATICTARVACIEEACIVSHLLNFDGASASFNYHIHSFGVHFNNLVHTFQQKDNATVNRHCTAGNAGSRTTRSYRHKIFIGNFHNLCYFFSATGQYNYFRQMVVARVSFFISFVTV